MKLNTITRTLALSAGLLLAGALATSALAQELAVKNWKAYTLVPTAQYWDLDKARLDDGTVGFTFPQLDDESFTVYLLANYNGDLREKVITAVVKVVADVDTKFWTRSRNGDDASVRLEFQSAPSTPNYSASDYWWSTGDNSLKLSVIATPPPPSPGTSWKLEFSTADLTKWSNIDGDPASDYPDLFAKALKNVKQISLAFGRPGSYASGVAVSGGSATFQLVSYTITPTP